MIKFTVPAVPVAQPRQRHRIIAAAGKQFVSNYTPKNSPVNVFKASCQMAAAEAYKGAPLDGPIIVELLFIMPRPSSLMWKTRPMPRMLHAKKPDVDNLAKSVLDALSGLLFIGDSMIYSLKVVKLIASGDEQPHVEVRIYEPDPLEEKTS